MPAGKSFNHGYGSRANEGMGYREIAERMTEALIKQLLKLVQTEVENEINNFRGEA